MLDCLIRGGTLAAVGGDFTETVEVLGAAHAATS